MAIELDLARILQLFVIQLIIALFFVYLAFRILKKNKSRLNISFSLFYILTAIGAFINIIYSVIDNEIAVTTLNFITNFCVSFSLIFLYTTNQIILKSEVVFTKKDQLKITVLYGILLFLTVLFYPFGQGVIINESTNWKPLWKLPFFLYVVAIDTIIATIPILLTSIKIFREFKDEDLKKRWIFFLIGLGGLFAYMYGVFLNNFLNQSLFRTIFTIYSLTVVLWVYLIYYGIGRQIK
jgi:hypothetical protein